MTPRLLLSRSLMVYVRHKGVYLQSFLLSPAGWTLCFAILVSVVILATIMLALLVNMLMIWYCQPLQPQLYMLYFDILWGVCFWVAKTQLVYFTLNSRIWRSLVEHFKFAGHITDHACNTYGTYSSFQPGRVRLCWHYSWSLWKSTTCFSSCSPQVWQIIIVIEVILPIIIWLHILWCLKDLNIKALIEVTFNN